MALNDCIDPECLDKGSYLASSDRAKKIRKKLWKRLPNKQVLDRNDIACEPWYAMSENSF